jgi:ribonucleoside-diphosphate reductase alpha chain
VLPSLYQEIIHQSRYARFLPEKNRRETYEETVGRLIDYLNIQVLSARKDEDSAEALSNILIEEIKPAILNLDIMPSMRLLMTAGEACERDNISAYNCSYLAVNNKRAFSEALYILMNGTGVGFSCERQEVAKLPAIPSELKHVPFMRM